MKIPLTTSIGIKYPIFQAPMAGGITTPSFCAEISEFGALGAIATGYLNLEHIESQITAVRKQTSCPFQVNIFVDYNAYPAKAYPLPKEIIALEKELGLGERHEFTFTPPPSISQLLDLILANQISILSTTFDLLKKEDIERLKAEKVLIMTTVNSVKEARIAIESQDSEVLIVQTDQAGGHKGGFLKTESYSSLHDFTLLMKEFPNRYWIKAGGVITKEDYASSLQQGFDGVQIGSGFLATHESNISQGYKQSLLDSNQDQDTAFTTRITGKSARGMVNRLSRLEVEEELPFPFMHYATATLRQAAKAQNRLDLQSLWAGAGTPRIHKISTLKDYLIELTNGGNSRLNSL